MFGTEWRIHEVESIGREVQKLRWLLPLLVEVLEVDVGGLRSLEDVGTGRTEKNRVRVFC